MVENEIGQNECIDRISRLSTHVMSDQLEQFLVVGFALFNVVPCSIRPAR